MAKYNKEKATKYESEPITSLNEITPEIIQTYISYIKQVKTYKAVQVNPALAVMQTTADDDFFPMYPLTEEVVEHTFEKVLFNKKDRYFNTDKRITAMRALLVGPFINNLPMAIPKVMRYIAAAV